VSSGGFTVNLHNGKFYGQWGVSRNYPAFSLTPSASATVGYIVGGADAQSTDGFLQGGALWGGAYVPTGVPFLNVGGGLNHGYTGGTSIEFGVSTSAGGTATPLNYGFKPKSN
jgi:hypothetical protein